MNAASVFRVIASALLLAPLACGPKTPPATVTPRPTPPAVGFRLPLDARPLAYRMTLDVDPAAESIAGTGEIDIERTSAGGILYLSAHELTIEGATLLAGSDVTVPLTATPVANEMIALVPTDPARSLPAGKATVQIAWRARVHRADTQGAFHQKNAGEWFAFTQFEPTSARRVFPCFDEPGFKVPWRLTLRVPSGLTALSNTPALNEVPEGAFTRVRFAETPPLPSYLIAYTVGPYEMVDAGKTRGGAPVRVAVPRGKAAEATIPVEDTVPILSLLEDYFGTPYPYAKLDLVPVPDTVGFSAMENVGLVTFSSSRLLTKPADRTYWTRRGYANVAAHEIAHQWFGNLVTPAWWDDIWLNESFATWMGNRVVDRWKPEWELDLANVASKGRVMTSDSRDSTRQIREAVGDANGILDAFDPGIVYGKGRAILAMVEAHLGSDTFQKGVRLHLKKHAGGNATYADLAATLQEVSGQDVRAVMDDFVTQPGVPFVRFTTVCERGKTPRIEMTQRRFVPYSSTIDPNRTWHIPIVLRYQTGGESGSANILLSGPSGTVPLAGATACPDWVLPNAGGSGYYRWSLDDAAFAKLLAPAVFKALPAEERLEVASSVSALVASNDLPYRRSVEMAVTLVDDPVRQVRQIGVAAGAGWAKWLPPEVVPRYRAWVTKTYGPLSRELGFDAKKGESEDDKPIRSQVLSRMVEDADDAATIKEAKRLCAKWLDDRTALAPEMVDLVLGMAARHGDAKLYERFLAEARKADAAHDKNERERYLDALASFHDLALVDRTRKLVLGDEFPILETSGFLWDRTDTKEGQERAWSYLTANHDAIVARLPAEQRASLISIGGDCTSEGLERTKAFFQERTKKELKGPQVYARFVESQNLCIARRAQDTASFVELLMAPQSSSPRK